MDVVVCLANARGLGMWLSAKALTGLACSVPLPFRKVSPYIDLKASIGHLRTWKRLREKLDRRKILGLKFATSSDLFKMSYVSITSR